MIYIILLLGLILRLVLINQSFWLDEASQALISSQSLNEIILNSKSDFHPPLSYILSHFWIKFGNSEIWLRLLPVLFGTAAIFVTYLIARKLFSEKVALTSALLISIAPYHIYYSQEFRMYSMVTFFISLTIYYFLKLLDKQSKLNSALFITSSLLAIYTHYLGGIIFLPLLIYILLFHKKFIKKFLSYLLLIVIGFSVWLPMLYQQLTLGVKADSYLPGWTQMLSLAPYKAVPLLFIKFIIGRIDFDNNLIYKIIILISFSIFGLAVYPLIKKIKNHSLIFIILWLLVPIFTTLLISFKVPMFQPFRLLFVLPAFFILVAFGISNFKKFQKLIFGLIILVLIFGNSIFYLNNKYMREDWKGAMSYLSNNQTNQSVIIASWPEPFPPMYWYGQRLNMRGVSLHMPASIDDIQTQLMPLSELQTIFYLDYLSQLSDPNQVIEQQLKLQGYNLVDTKDFSGVGLIYRYEKIN